MPLTRAYCHLQMQPWILSALAAVLVVMLLPPCRAMAGSDLELTVKSAYVYNFIQFIDWPEPQAGRDPAAVKICMVGNGQFGAALAELASRQVKGRPILVERDASCDDTLTACHVVVIGQSMEDQLPGILSQVAGANVLTVSDIPHFAKKGGGIGFVTNEGKVKVEINPQATQQAGLKVSAKLLEVARIVQ